MKPERPVPHYTYDELEQEIEAREGSIFETLLSSIRSIFGTERPDPAAVREQRNRVVERYHERTAAAVSLLESFEATSDDDRDGRDELSVEIDRACADIDDCLEAIRSLRDGSAEYLRANEHEELREHASDLRDRRASLHSRQTFRANIDSVSNAVSELREAATPLFDYDAYLTRPRERRIRDRLEDSRGRIAALEERVSVDALPQSDRERLERIHDLVDIVEDTLDGYNERFVERQRDAYQNLFEDIDADGHDLNVDQQRAIVRNGIYNQVIAAAGTGKTFALTYRVAYLVAEGVDPGRIAAITFTNEAATEMEQRLDDQFGITEVEAETIHTFARSIARESSDAYRTTPKERDVINLIEDVIREETGVGRSPFENHFVKFLYHDETPAVDEADFEDRSEYVADRRQQDYETLAGEEVASLAEKTIADFLFTHGVEYQYESIAEWADTAAEKGPYRPDFYLPDHDLYIEHWGLNEAGAVAPWFSWSTSEYLGKLRWAREEFERTDHRLVETYDFEHEAARLERVLFHRLETAGVELERMGFEEFVDSTFEYARRESDIKRSLKSFVENAKTFDIGVEEIDQRLTRRNPKQYHFGKCGQIILRRYEAYLDRNDLIDFDDMIYDAIEAIEAAPEEYRSRYDRLLVDEFQDVSMSQIRLVRNLVGAQWDTRLFCVGDDWQGIFSFQGSDVEYFVDFETHFGPAVKTYLTANYRCPETVLEAGNELIGNNDAQIEKTVTAESGRDTTPKLHTLSGYRDADYEQRVGEYVADLVVQFGSDGSDADDIMVLCRYDHGAPYLDSVKTELRNRGIPYDGKNDHYRPPGMPGEHDDDFDPEVGVSVFSVHQSKGREARHVVLVHAVTGEYGFPPKERDDTLIEPVQDVETNTVEEERRLFYVAITRAEHDLHILTRKDERSPFLAEIDDYLVEERSLAAPGEVGNTTSLTAKVAMLWDDTHDSQRQAGLLEDETGRIKFVSWENDDPVTVEENVWYRFDDVKIDEFNDDRQVELRADSTATELYDDEAI